MVRLSRAALLLVWVIAPGIGASDAAPPENADPNLAPWFESLKQPGSGVSCCSIADCRPVEYRLVADGPLRNYYPAWFAATGCGPTDYDLQPGRSVKTGEFVMPYTGTLLGVGGHLHDYGRRLLLENITRSEAIATLTPKLDSDGQMLSVPTVSFTTNGGYRLSRGDVVKVTATYDSPMGHGLSGGAMGIVVGYFVPAEDREFDALVFRRSPRAPGRRTD